MKCMDFLCYFLTHSNLLFVSVIVNLCYKSEIVKKNYAFIPHYMQDLGYCYMYHLPLFFITIFISNNRIHSLGQFHYRCVSV